MDAAEREIISRCLQGDEEAFGDLYHAHAGRVRGYFLRSGFAPADADDRVQEVFLRVFKSLGTFSSPRGTFSQWLSTIARNVARKHWQRRRHPQDFDPALADEMFASENPTETPESREQTQAVRQCVDSLPGELARILRLRYVDGLTTRGIASAAGMAEATVRLRLKEATALVEQCLRTRGVYD